MPVLDKKCTVTCPKSGKRVDTLLVCQCGENDDPCPYFKNDNGLCLYCSFPNIAEEAEG